MTPPAPVFPRLPEIQLRLGRTWFAPGDSVIPELVIRNGSDAPLPLPAGASELRVIQPDASETILSLELDRNAVPPRGEYSTRISLPPDVMQAAGRYGLIARLSGPSGFRSESDAIYALRDGPCLWSCAVPANRGRLDVSAAYGLQRGACGTALYRFGLAWEQEMHPEQVRITEAVWLSDLDARTRGVVVMAARRPSVTPSSVWLAWWDNRSVSAGFDFMGLQEKSLALPFECGGVVREVVPSSDGGCRILAVSADRRSIAWLAFHRPDEERLVLQAFAGDEEPDEDFTGTVEEPEPEPEPVPEPRVVWRHTFDTPFHDCAIAAGIGEYELLRGLAVLTVEPEGSWIHYCTFEDDEEPGEFRRIGLPGSPLPDCPPALALDRQGRGQVFVLMREHDEHQDRIVGLRAAFDRDGWPRLDAGAILMETAPLPRAAEPAGGAAEFLIDDRGGPWSIAWCVVLTDGRRIAGTRGSEPLLLPPPGGPVGTPPALLAIPERTFVAGQTASGTLTFFDCG